MKHAQEYLETMELLAPLLRDVPKYCIWQFDLLCDWFSYQWNRGTFFFVIDDGNARGVCTVKLFNRLEGFLEPFIHEPAGRFCMIEALSADGPSTFGRLVGSYLERWGPREVVLWDRGERTESGTPRMYGWPQFEKLARRFTKNGRI